MDTLLHDSFEEITKKIDVIWNFRNSHQDIINLESDLPLRYMRNELGTRNIELFLECQFGFFTKTIALVENDTLIFTKEFEDIANKTPVENFEKFKHNFFRKEINLLMGAFSIATLMTAIKQTDVEYSSYNQNFELLKAFDNTMQCFFKTKAESFAFGKFDALNTLKTLGKTELDDVALSAFKFENGLEIFPTADSHSWMDRLKSQRLLEIFTIENI